MKANILKLLVERGDPAASLVVAVMAENGHAAGLGRDDILSLYRAAQNLSPTAMLALAIFLIKEKRDNQEGFVCAVRGAELGSPEALALVGICYSGGIGVTANREEAERWLNKSASAESALGHYLYGAHLLEEKDNKSSRDRAIHHLRKAAEQNILAAQSRLAILILEDGASSEASEAVRLLKAAADGEDYLANNRLSALYREGTHGVGKDSAKANYYSARASKLIGQTIDYF